jgi:hypothetical protein
MMIFAPHASAAALMVVALATSNRDFESRKPVESHTPARTAAAVIGIYGYDADSSGAKLDATNNRYVLHFSQEQLPPVNAFWSITLYELPTSLQYANALNRYLINSSMLSGLKRDADGGLTIYVQHESPGEDKESNWLPAPAGPFRLAMRLYCAKSDVVNDRWKVPPRLEVESAAATRAAR